MKKYIVTLSIDIKVEADDMDEAASEAEALFFENDYTFTDLYVKEA